MSEDECRSCGHELGCGECIACYTCGDECACEELAESVR